MTKQSIFICLLSLILASCGGSEFEGVWIDTDTESVRVNIEENGSHYIVENGVGKKYIAELDGDFLLINVSNQAVVKATVDKKGHLIFDGYEFMRIEESTSYVLEQETRWETVDTVCQVIEAYEKDGLAFLAVDYLEVQEMNGHKTKFKNSQQTRNAFHLSEDTKIYDEYDVLIPLENIGKQEYIKYPAWKIKAVDGRVIKMRQFFVY